MLSNVDACTEREAKWNQETWPVYEAGIVTGTRPAGLAIACDRSPRSRHRTLAINWHHVALPVSPMTTRCARLLVRLICGPGERTAYTSTPDIVLEDSPASSTQMLSPQPHASTSRQQSYQSTAPSSYKYTPDEEEPDVFDPFSIDPEYRLRTVRTAASAIAESIRTERDAEDRKRRRRIFKSFRSRRNTTASGKGSLKRKGSEAPTDEGSASDFGTPRNSLVPQPSDSGAGTDAGVEKEDSSKSKTPAGQRRTLYVNIPLPTGLLDTKGDPTIRYVRNKVRTSKYTILTFVPKNLFEQFRRAANIYFLALVVLQLFSVFGAPNPQIGMLPLLAILGMTAIKDGVEDWRRARLDNEVNNSAATKLGGWRNVNQPVDPRTWLERVLGLNGERMHAMWPTVG